MKRILPIIVLALLLGLPLYWIARILQADRRSDVRGRSCMVHVLDAGQGECVLIQTPDQRNILIDAMDEREPDRVIDYLKRHGVGRIDLLVMMRPETNETDGLLPVIDAFGIGMVLDPGCDFDSPLYRELRSTIAARGIRCKPADEWQGEQVSTDVRVEILWPTRDRSPEHRWLRSCSLVLRLAYGDVSMLLAGDLSQEDEGLLLASRPELESTILRVANHGDRRTTSNEFLQTVQPQYAVVSVDTKDPGKRPADSTLKRLSATGARVYRTDLNGNVIFDTDGRTIRVSTER